MQHMKHSLQKMMFRTVFYEIEGAKDVAIESASIPRRPDLPAFAVDTVQPHALKENKEWRNGKRHELWDLPHSSLMAVPILYQRGAEAIYTGSGKKADSGYLGYLQK